MCLCGWIWILYVLVCLYTCVRFTCVFCLVCLISLGMCYIRWRLCASWIHYQYIRDPGSQIRDPQSWLVNLGSMIQDPRSSILDRRPRVLYTPSRILDPGFRILDHASFILAQDSGSWIQFSESWIQDAGSRMQDQKSWIQHPGYWILDKLRYSICLENTSENNQIGGTGRTAFTVFPTACKCMQLLAPCV